MKRSRTLASLGALYLVMLVLLAAFADLLASSAPIVASRGGQVELLPGLRDPERFRHRTPEQIEADLAADWAVWPLVRASSTAPSAAGPLAPASAAHPLGTDSDGVDVLARSLHGARSAVLAAVAVVVFAVVFGVAGGALAGIGPRAADALLARAVEVTGALPTVILIALVHAIRGSPSLGAFVVVVGVLRSVEVARLVRGEVLRVGGQDFVLAARALGAAPRRVLTTHVLPHILGPVFVSAAFAAATVVALEAAVAFVGLGVSQSPSWGALLAQAGRGAGFSVLLWPALGVSLTVASLYFVADALDDAVSARRGARARA